MHSIGACPAIFIALLQCIFTFPYTEGWGSFNRCHDCGRVIIQPTFRIVGGDEVKLPRKYPWMVSISSQESKEAEKIMCGGALISSQFVLTAAHCLMNEAARQAERCDPPGDCFQLASDVQLHTWPNSTYKRRLPVARLIPHPDFKFDSNVLTDDIALVQLVFMVTCDAYITPICLPDRDLSNFGGQLIVAGWGDSSGKKKDKVQSLKEGTVTQVNPYYCMNKGQSTAPARNIICSVSKYSGQVGCYGDSGTPVFQQFHGLYYGLGVSVDHTSKTCDPKKPMIYTKVYAYWGWIRSNVRFLPRPRKGNFF